ncbi:hypothetical protein CEH05_10040 [Halobacillus halophilus]|uniref:Flagellar hook-length control protein-like C-terminal domain-containing protein n=1 Tax=Halobacillus halophilus (strain ATCC 35676 / DSM 2266 / JCM 20832 / KCTC 3685 / LMG 17431 / NBRC 102448 / NCIMB 2269) TaxID=866895 RepID=I0JMJ6_HALH3|nr:hypothetical protein [Halobacillus halophilus]ASF39448.1 hypothetical protein CEH05_10040 [Halobacillus halophilus]CCG45366.1 hypothetical protein HBHAL_3019 [Halobacillus halophilus DSM 2266]
MNLISSLSKLVQQQEVRALPKTGQVINGKILELLPQNRAVVQLGSQQVKAQLEASLSKGKSYLFQVGSTDQKIQLKVITQLGESQRDSTVKQLLDELGIKPTKENRLLTSQLIKKSVPFQGSDLKQAAALHQRAEDIKAAREILVQMLQKQLPIKPSVYNALHTKRMDSVTQTMKQVHIEASKSKTAADRAVMSLLASLKGEGASVSLRESSVVKLMTEVNINSQNSFQLFKKAGILDSKASYTSFQNTWTEWAGAHSKGNENPSSTYLASLSKKSAPPFPMAMEKLAGRLKQLFHQQLPLKAPEQQSLHRVMNQVEKVLAKEIPSGNDSLRSKHNTFGTNQSVSEDFQFLKEREVLTKISSLYTDEKNQKLLQDFLRAAPILLTEGGSSEKQVIREGLSVLKKWQSTQLPPILRQTLTEWIGRSAAELSLSEKEAIFVKMKTMLDLTGLQEESNVKPASAQEKAITQESSLKTLLLSSLQDASSIIRPETAKKMIQMLNGMQLTAQQETNQSLQMSLQFPGNIIGSENDVYLDMAGRKTKEGNIDPDYCHIMFFLDLNNFKETIINLNIVSRWVRVTVFNHDSLIELPMETHKASLKIGLENMGYELTSLNIKEMNHAVDTSGKDNALPEYKEGIDLRI